MYREEAKGSKAQRRRGFFGVLGALLAVYAAMLVLGALKIRYSVFIVIALLCVMTYFIYRLIRYSMTTYIYTLDADTFTIKSAIGSKETLIVSVSADNIICIEKESAGKLKREKMAYVCCGASSSSPADRYVCIFREDKKRCAAIFTPSSTLLEKLALKNIKVSL